MQRTNKPNHMPDAINRSVTKEFTQVPNEVIRSPEMSAKAVKILCILLSNKEGWTSYRKTIQGMMKEGENAIDNAIRELQKFGYLKKIRIRDKETKLVTGSIWMYTDTANQFSSLQDYAKAFERYGMEMMPHDRNEETANPNFHQDENHDDGVHNNGNPSLRILRDKKTNDKKDQSQVVSVKKSNQDILLEEFSKNVPEEFNRSDDFVDTVIDWFEYRNEIKATVTHQVVKRQAKFLAKLTLPEAIEALEQSMRNGWRGLFPPKNNQSKAPEPTESPPPETKSFPEVKRILGLNNGDHEYIRGVKSIEDWTEQQREQIKQKIYDENDPHEPFRFALMKLPLAKQMPVEYAEWLTEQNWIENIGPSLFNPNSKMFKRFLKDCEKRHGYSMTTGERVYG